MRLPEELIIFDTTTISAPSLKLFLVLLLCSQTIPIQVSKNALLKASQIHHATAQRQDAGPKLSSLIQKSIQTS